MKLRKLHIENYKMFKKFDISFLDENDEVLPIIVLAGVNGSGKTTLFEYIMKTVQYEKIELYGSLSFELDDLQILNIKDYKGVDLANTLDIKGHITSLINLYGDDNAISLGYSIVDKLIYLTVDTNLKDIKKLLPEYLRKMVWNEDIKASEAFERVRNHIKTIFQDLDIQIEFDSRDDEENLFFRNKGGDRFSIDTLSTGEKTLISKVLFLYLDEVKNKVILIDEPELSLHPSWQNKILKIYENFAVKNNCQIIIATHSPHIIASSDNKYIRFLKKDEEGNISIINDVQAYGRDIKWVLKQMGVENLRVSEILEKFIHCQQLLNDEEYDKAEKCIDDLEDIIGENDSEILTLRNDLAFERMDFEEDN